MTNPHPAQIKWKDPLALARDIRKRLHLIADPSVRLDMEAMCDEVERLCKALEDIEDGGYLCNCTGEDDHRDNCPRIIARAALR